MQRGNHIIIGSSTQVVAGAVLTLPSNERPLDVTADTRGQHVIGSQTLKSGGAITVADKPISLNSAGSQVVVGTRTEGVVRGSVITGLGTVFGGGGDGIVTRTGRGHDGGAARSATVGVISLGKLTSGGLRAHPVFADVVSCTRLWEAFAVMGLMAAG